MARTAKICRGSWCLAFGFERPATLEQVARDDKLTLDALLDKHVRNR